MMRKSAYALCASTIFMLLVHQCAPANILVVMPMPWKSHHFVAHPIMKALAAKGHQIDYLTPVQMKNPPANVRHFLLKDNLQEHMDRIRPEDLDQSFPPSITRLFRWQVMEAMKPVFKQEVVQNLLASNDTYDMVISEFQLFQEISTIWVHKFKALAVGLSVQGEVATTNEMNGLPDNPAYMVDIITDYTARMDFMQRFWNTIYFVCNTAVNYHNMWEQQQMADELARYPGWEDRPPLWKLASDMALVLVNMHHAVGHSVPKAPHVKEIGGMTLTGPTELPQELQSFMDDASEGVVYFSLGSNVDANEMTKGKLESILNMFRQLKCKVIMKWSGSNMPAVQDSKIIIRNWLPQLGILNHPNTKVFVTHGGLQSTMETVRFGIPIVGVPVFADQPKNVNFLVSVDIGVKVDKRNFTAEALRWAIHEVTENPRYKEAVMKRAALLKHSSMNPLDEAVYWIEYVLAHGKVLQPASVHMPFYQVYLLDVMTFFIAIVFAVYKTIKFLVKSIFCRVCGGSTPSSKKNKKD